MKRIWFKRSLWQSVLSLVVLGIFAYLAIGSLGVLQEKKHLGGGVYENTKFLERGILEVTTGTMDEYNNWNGYVNIKYLGKYGELKATERVKMIHGKRDGHSTITFNNWQQEEYMRCYEMGNRVECNKSAMIDEKSAYDIFNYKYPWVTAKLNAFDFTDKYIRAFMDTFEVLIGENEFDITKFESYYNDASDILEETHFDSILVLNAEFSIYNGLELINFDEFRMAAIDQHRSTDSSIYKIIKLKYPNYLSKLMDFEISESDFQLFGQKFDSLIFSYGPLDASDPFYVDSIDSRMFNAISFIASEENALAASHSLKSLKIYHEKPDYIRLMKAADLFLQNLQSNKNPHEVATVIVEIISMKFGEGDLVKRSLYEAFSIKKGVVNFATVTTGILKSNSNASVTLKGNIISNGGGAIITKGFYYGTVYNPDSTNFSVVAKDETVNFEAQINKLSEGVTYYARAFAKNSAGIAYGNSISFTTNGLVGTKINELSEKTFDIFPNPSSGLTTLRFNFQSAGNAEIVIVNVKGQIVAQKNLGILPPGENNIQIDLSTLETGIYNCRLMNKRETTGTVKFIIAR